MIGKSLPRHFGVDAFRGVAWKTFGRLALPGKIVAQDHAAAGGAVIGQQAIRQIEHDVALVFFARALLHEVFDLEHQIIGEGAEQAEQGIIVSAERREPSAAGGGGRGSSRRPRRPPPLIFWPASRDADLSVTTTQGSRKTS